MALTYTYHIAWREHENMSPCTGIRVNVNHKPITSWFVMWFDIDGLFNMKRHLSQPTAVVSFFVLIIKLRLNLRNPLRPSDAYICVSKIIIIGPDNGLWPSRRQPIIWTYAGILLIGPLGTNFSDILIEINTFSFFKEIHLQMSSGKCRSIILASVC